MNDDFVFESEVRRIASILWPTAKDRSPCILDGRERDGVFITEDIGHIVEATTSRKKDKAANDLQKSVDLIRTLRQQLPAHNFKIWLVTKDTPTADQKSLEDEFRKRARCPVQVISAHGFRYRIVDTRSYLSHREDYPFGSVRNPTSNSFNVPKDNYIRQVTVDAENFHSLFPDEIALRLLTGDQKIIMLGDYGTGKSMTLREVYFHLKDRHLQHANSQFPLYINLRDHFGQYDPAEALIRHATLLGMREPSQLVAAWRAGYVILLLDGFDELASARFVRGASNLKHARRSAMRLVANFLRESPERSSTIVAGRQHYFDDHVEMKTAFGSGDFSIFELQEFDSDQVRQFLLLNGIHSAIPDWLPSRPLFLEILVSLKNFDFSSFPLRDLPPEKGWDFLIDKVCEREAEQIDPVNIQPKIVREFVESLATRARMTTSGRGPLNLADMREVFLDTFDIEPDENAEVFLYRFAGLTASPDGNSREFIDESFVDACRAGDLVRFFDAQHDRRALQLLESSFQMRELGIRVALQKLGRVTSKHFSHVFSEACEHEPASAVVCDLIHLGQDADLKFEGGPLIVSEGIYEFVELSGQMAGLGRLTFRDCLFDRVEIDVSQRDFPKFDGGEINKLVGPVTEVEAESILRCDRKDVKNIISAVYTNNAVLEMDIELNVRVFLTVLRKLFLQRGSGRRENAFFRGLDQRARSYVSDILEALRSHGFAAPLKLGGPTVWIPDRDFAPIARSILENPSGAIHPIMYDVRKL